MLKLVLVIFASLIVTGCEGNDTVIDETLPTTIHFAIDDEIDEHGWQNFITIESNTDDIITFVEINSIRHPNVATRRDLAQFGDYEDAFGYNFYEQAKEIEQSLVGLSRDELADAIRIANHDNIVDFDTTSFANLASLALQHGAIDVGNYIDGWYQSVSDIDEEGLRYYVNLYVLHGSIIAVHWNAVNEEGVLMYDPQTGAAISYEALQWSFQAQLVEQELIQRQDPALFAFDEDGLSTDITNIDIKVESFISLATEALAAGPLTREAR